MDACSGANVTLTEYSTLTNNSSCQTIITRTWKATDTCSNSAYISQRILMQDTNPPLMFCSGNKSVECGSSLEL